MDKIVLLIGGVFALKAFAGIDVLGMLFQGSNGATNPSNPSNPTNTSPNTTTQPPAFVGQGGAGTAITYNANNNSGRPTGADNPTNPNSTGTATTSPVYTTSTTANGGRDSGAGNVMVNTTNNGSWVDSIGSGVIRDLTAVGLSPQYNFHQWNYLYRDAGSTVLPSPEDAGMGNGMEIISLDQYKAAIRRYAGLGGVQNFMGSQGLGVIAVDRPRNPNAATVRATPVEQIPRVRWGNF